MAEERLFEATLEPPSGPQARSFSPKGTRMKPLIKCNTLSPITRELITQTMRETGCTFDEAKDHLKEHSRNCTYWINDFYQVEVRPCGEQAVVLNIRRRDGKAIMRDWRHFQAIKNQLVGEECEGIELYPAESRLWDTCNKYHIWCVTDPTFRFGFGYQGRQVSYDTSNNHVPGLTQRKNKP